jgi:hypothetical protein
MGKRLMKLPFTHRVGLTATPARTNAVEAFDLAKWSSGAKELGSRAKFVRTFQGFGSGTNAQDTAVGQAFFQTLQPYMSGDRLTTPSFKTSHEAVRVPRSATQVAAQRRIEATMGAPDEVDRRAREIRAEANADPGHRLRRRVGWDRSPAVQARASREAARAETAEAHQGNLSGGDWRDNAKLQALHGRLGEPGKKHVIFLDSRTQRTAVSRMLLDLGYTRAQVKNIAASTGSMSGADMARRVRDFRTDPRVNHILIDRSSASGYNLQQGDELHVIGTPPDAATYLQAQGRVAREPRVGDVSIRTYRYSDAPEEAGDWINLDAQLKVLRATAPGMFTNL